MKRSLCSISRHSVHARRHCKMGLLSGSQVYCLLRPFEAQIGNLKPVRGKSLHSTPTSVDRERGSEEADSKRNMAMASRLYQWVSRDCWIAISGGLLVLLLV